MRFEIRIEENFFFSRDSESAWRHRKCNQERLSFATRIRWKKSCLFFSRRFGGQRCAEKNGTRGRLRFGPRDSDGEKAAWRHAKVQPGEARFGPELDGEKLWRHQVFGGRMREKNG